MIRLFFSYAQEDESLREQLEDHLASLRRPGLIEDWHDGKIGAGVEWDEQISEQLEAAHIILLLVSRSFIASDYIYAKELKRALERHQAGTARVIPVILRPCNWKGQSFSHLQATPRKGKPVVKFRPRDEGFLEVTEAVEKAARELGATGEEGSRPEAPETSAATDPPTAPPAAGGESEEAATPAEATETGATGSPAPVRAPSGGQGSGGGSASPQYSWTLASLPEAIVLYLTTYAPSLLPVFTPLVLVAAVVFMGGGPAKGYEDIIGELPDANVKALDFVGHLFEPSGNFWVSVVTFVSTCLLIYAALARLSQSYWRPSVYLVVLTLVVALTLATLPCLWAPGQIHGVYEKVGVTKPLDYSPRFPVTLPLVRRLHYDKVFSWYYGVDPAKGRLTPEPDPDQVKKLGEHFNLLSALGIWGALWLAILVTMMPPTRPLSRGRSRGDWTVLAMLIALSALVAIQWIALIGNYGRLVLAAKFLQPKAALLEGEEPDYYKKWPRSQMYFARPESSEGRLCMYNQWPHELDDTELHVSVVARHCDSLPIGSWNDATRERLYCERSTDASGEPMYTDGELAREAGLVEVPSSDTPARWRLSDELARYLRSCGIANGAQTTELWLTLIPVSPESEFVGKESTSEGIWVILKEIESGADGRSWASIHFEIEEFI